MYTRKKIDSVILPLTIQSVALFTRPPMKVFPARQLNAMQSVTVANEIRGLSNISDP